MTLTITDYRKLIKENMTTEDKNILIAKFLGPEYSSASGHIGNAGKYHEEWAWLMPVVEFILGLELDEGRFFNRFCEEMASGSGIDGVYAAVVEAIEYINENE